MDYNTIPTADIIEKTAAALRERGVEVTIVRRPHRSARKSKRARPKGASVNNGSSVTLAR